MAAGSACAPLDLHVKSPNTIPGPYLSVWNKRNNTTGCQHREHKRTLMNMFEDEWEWVNFKCDEDGGATCGLVVRMLD